MELIWSMRCVLQHQRTKFIKVPQRLNHNIEKAIVLARSILQTLSVHGIIWACQDSTRAAALSRQLAGKEKKKKSFSPDESEGRIRAAECVCTCNVGMSECFVMKISGRVERQTC
jgi:hypothetical protein